MPSLDVHSDTDEDEDDDGLRAHTQPSTFFPTARPGPGIWTLYAPGKRTSQRLQDPVAVPVHPQTVPHHPAKRNNSVFQLFGSTAEVGGRISAVSLLMTVRLSCLPDDDARPTAEPNETATNEENVARYTARNIHWRSLATLHPIERQRAFCRAMLDVPKSKSDPPAGPYFFSPQIPRVLLNEADCSCAFLANTLHPLLPLLNDLIAPEYRHAFEVAILSEVTDTGEATGMRLDRLVCLVDRPTARNIRLQHRPLRVRIPLVIFEMKRTGLVHSRDWKTVQLDTVQVLASKSNASHLPQLSLYGHRWRCRRVYLSDYVYTFAFFLSPEQFDLPDTVMIDLGMHFCARKSPKQRTSAYDCGLRTSIAFDVAEALRELGVADHKLSDGPHPPLHADLRAIFHSHAT